MVACAVEAFLSVFITYMLKQLAEGIAEVEEIGEYWDQHGLDLVIESMAEIR